MQLKSYLRGFGCGMFISAVLMGIAVSYSRNTMSDEEIKLRAAELGMVEEDSVLVRPADIAVPTPVVQINPVDDNKDTDTDGGASNGGNDSREKAENENDDITEESDITAKEDNESDTVSESAGDMKEEEDSGDDKYTDEDRLSAMGMNSSSSKNNTGNLTESRTDTDNDTYSGTDNNTDSMPEVKTEVKTGAGTGSDAETGSKTENRTKSTETYTLEISKGATSESVSRLLKQGGLIDNSTDFDSYLCRNGYDKRIQDGVFTIPAGAGYEDIAKIITRTK